MRRTLQKTGSRSPHSAGAAPGLQVRSGFTLVELLVVITILTILFGLSFAVLGTAGDKAKINSTKTTIAFLNEALKQRQQAFAKDLTDQERTRKRESGWGNILSNAITYVPVAGSLDAAKVLVAQDRYRGLFPQRVGDMLGLDQASGGAGPFEDSPMTARLLSYATSNGAMASDFTATPETESSELLYFMLTEGADGIATDLLNNIPSKHIGDTDGDGLKEFLDDWGHPLRFYNAPTAMYAPATMYSSSRNYTSPPYYNHASAAVAAALMPGFHPVGASRSDPLDPYVSADPLDPNGVVTQTLDNSGPLPFVFSYEYHHRAMNFTPLIVSCGPDEILGLFEPNDTSTATSRLAGVYGRLVGGVYTVEPDTAMDNVTNIQPTGGQ